MYDFPYDFPTFRIVGPICYIQTSTLQFRYPSRRSAEKSEVAEVSRCFMAAKRRNANGIPGAKDSGWDGGDRYITNMVPPRNATYCTYCRISGARIDTSQVSMKNITIVPNFLSNNQPWHVDIQILLWKSTIHIFKYLEHSIRFYDFPWDFPVMFHIFFLSEGT